MNPTGYGPSRARLYFDGDESKFELWEVKFLAHLRTLKLASTILPAADGGVPDEEINVEKNAECFSWIVQMIDDRSLSLIIRDAKENGRKALEILREYYTSSGKPKVIALYTELTSLKLQPNEGVTDYMIRAETAAASLKRAGEIISDSLLVAMVIKGLPVEYKPFNTVITQKKEQVSFTEFKVALRSYEETVKYCDPSTDDRSSSSVMFQRDIPRRFPDVKCYSCGQIGHKSNDPNCPDFKKQPKRPWCDWCRTNTHFTQQCRKKKGNYHAAKSMDDDNDHSYQFHVAVCDGNNVKTEQVYSMLVDCGATTHIVTDKSKFVCFDQSFSPSDHFIELADGSRKNNLALGKGTAVVKLLDTNDVYHDCVLNNVLYVPSFKTDIFSVQSATSHGSCVTFDQDNAVLSCNGTEFNIVRQGRLYYLNSVCDSSDTSHTLKEWHEIMGHCNYNDVRKMKPHVDGMIVTDDVESECDVCMKGKMTQNSSRKPDARAINVLDFVHCDLSGPVDPVAKDGFRYALVFVDDYSGCTMTYFLKQKSDTVCATKRYLADIAPYGNVKCLRTDNGGEFTSSEFEALLIENKIKHQTSAPHSPHQNGTAERAWRSLFDMARCMLIESGLPKCMWTYAVMYAVYTRNRCYNSRLNMTSLEAMTGRRPDVSKMHTFGTKCFAYVQNAKKLDARCFEGVFVGHDKNSPAYLIYSHDNQTVKRVRCVAFSGIVPGSCVENKLASKPLLQDADDDDGPLVGKCVPSDTDEQSNTNVQNDEPRYPRRTNRGLAPKRYEHSVQSCEDENYCVDYCYNFVCDVPVNYSDAVSCNDAPNWREAMDDEMQSLLENNTWELTPLPEGRPAVGGKWVYAVKHGQDGDVKFKARFVAKGYSQQADVDYHETFSPTAHITSIRMLQQISVVYDLTVHQMDVKSAFLNADIDCEIYVEQPEGYEVLSEDGQKLYCKLNKSLYGLKQSGRNWNNLLHSHLVNEGFVQSLSDACLYTRNIQDVIMVVIVWVDDIIIACNDDDVRDKFKQRLCQLFKMKDLGEISHFIGMQFVRKDDCVLVNQSQFIRKVLCKFGMEDCKPRYTPCEINSNKPVETDTSEPADAKLYRSIVGSLIYIMTATRPDLCYVVTKLSQHMSDPTVKDLTMAKHVLRYLKSTVDYALVFKKSAEPLNLTGFCDSDWGGSDDRRSITGYCFRLSSNGPIISWKSKKQQTVALSTCEAEYVSICAAVQEGKYLTQIVNDMIPYGAEHGRFDLYCDNQGAIALCENPIQHQRSKHIDIKYHFIRSEFQNGVLNLMYVPTVDNVADVFTKPVSRARLDKFKLCY